jgi:tRNA dimethylallyltransferase
LSEPSPGPVVAVVGPTATGKSDLGLALAERLGGEIVNADAMQLYRGMDIGTAKLTPAEQRGVPHHQLDVLHVREESSVATYQRHSRADIADIRSRGRLPILVGGSGLYVRAALDRLEIPPTDPTVRARLEAELAESGINALRARLFDLDPAAADAIEPNNGRRIVRALEVVELTGRPFSATMPTREHVLPTVVVGMVADRPVLDERIDRRVRRMWDDGLVGETETLVRQGLRDGRTASKALGYRQALAQLDGTMTAEEAQDDTATATRRYARRQESWFRADARVVWLPHDASDLVDRALATVAALGG